MIPESIALFKARNKLAIDRVCPLAFKAAKSSDVLIAPVTVAIGCEGFGEYCLFNKSAHFIYKKSYTKNPKNFCP